MMNELNHDCFIGHDKEFYCTNTREYTNIPSCSGKLAFDPSRPQEEIFAYTLVKLYNKANILWLRTVNLTVPTLELSALDKSGKNGFFPVHSLFTLWNNVNETTGMFHSKGYVLWQKPSLLPLKLVSYLFQTHELLLWIAFLELCPFEAEKSRFCNLLIILILIYLFHVH